MEEVYVKNAFYYEVLAKRELLAAELSDNVHYRLGDDPKKEAEIKELNARLENDKTLLSKLNNKLPKN